MPAYRRQTIKKKTVTVSSSTPTLIASYDPAMISEIAGADDQIDFINVEQNASPVTLTYYRYEGARPDLLRAIDTSGQSINATGITKVTWTSPLGAASLLDIYGALASGSGTVTLENDTVFRVSGS